MTSHQTAELHRKAASNHLSAAEHHELAAVAYLDGHHEKAAHHALIAHAHMQHAGQFMSDAAKIHAERHGGNKHMVTGH